MKIGGEHKVKGISYHRTDNKHVCKLCTAADLLHRLVTV